MSNTFYSILDLDILGISSRNSTWWCVNHEIITLTLYLPKFLTLHVSTASLPTGYVTLDMDPINSGSSSAPWLISVRHIHTHTREEEKITRWNKVKNNFGIKYQLAKEQTNETKQSVYRKSSDEIRRKGEKSKENGIVDTTTAAAAACCRQVSSVLYSQTLSQVLRCNKRMHARTHVHNLTSRNAKTIRSHKLI